MNAFVLLIVVSRLYPPDPFEREEIDSAVKSHSPQMHSNQGIENRDEPIFCFSREPEVAPIRAPQRACHAIHPPIHSPHAVYTII